MTDIISLPLALTPERAETMFHLCAAYLKQHAPERLNLETMSRPVAIAPDSFIESIKSRAVYLGLVNPAEFDDPLDDTANTAFTDLADAAWRLAHGLAAGQGGKVPA